MLSSRKYFVASLLTFALILPVCASGENEAQTIQRLRELPVPALHPGPFRNGPSVDEQVPVLDRADWPPYGAFFSDCGEIEEYVGERLFYLGSRPPGFRPLRCWLSLAADERDHWGAGVLYLPTSARPESQSLLSVIEGGAVDIILSFNLRGTGPQPGDIDYAPTLPPSAAVVEVRGREGVIQRMSERHSRIAWSEIVGAMGNVEIVIEAGMDPARLYDLAKSLTRLPN